MSVPAPVPVEAVSGRQFREPLWDLLFLLTGWTKGQKHKIIVNIFCEVNILFHASQNRRIKE